jgi:hypothetical protein
VTVNPVTLNLSVNSIEWNARQSQAVVVSPSLGGPLPYLVRIPPEAAWLSANRSSGLTGEPVTFAGDPSGLAPGVYKTTVVIAIPGVSLTASLPVTLTVK